MTSPNTAAHVLVELGPLTLEQWFEAIACMAEGVVRVNMLALREGIRLPALLYRERRFIWIDDEAPGAASPQPAWPIRSLRALDAEARRSPDQTIPANCLELACLLAAMRRNDGDHGARVAVERYPNRDDGHAIVMTSRGLRIDAKDVLT